MNRVRKRDFYLVKEEIVIILMRCICGNRILNYIMGKLKWLKREIDCDGFCC